MFPCSQERLDWFPKSEMCAVKDEAIKDIDFERIDAILFDMGGVVVTLYPHRVFAHWAKASKTEIDDFVHRWALEQHYKDYETGRITFQSLAQSLSEQLGIDMGLDDWRKGWNALIGEAIPAVMNCVTQLARKRRLYCFTNSNPEHESVWASQFREELSVFEEVFNSSTIGLRKPDVQAYLDVANRMKFDPKRIFFLDDNRTNVEAARSCGMQAAHVPSDRETVIVLESLLNNIR